MAGNTWVVWPVAKMKMKCRSWRFFAREVVCRIFQNSKFCASLRTQDSSLNVCAYEFFGSLVIIVGFECLWICRTSPNRSASQTKNMKMHLSRQIASPCAVCHYGSNNCINCWCGCVCVLRVTCNLVVPAMGFVVDCKPSNYWPVPRVNVAPMASAWANTSLNCFDLFCATWPSLVQVDDLREQTSESSVDGFGLSELLVLVASTVIHNCYMDSTWCIHINM